MKDQLKTIQTGLAIAIDAEGFVDKPVRRALLEARTALSELERMAGEPVSHATVAGALFDFMGWLTSRRARLVLSSVDNAAPAADAIKEFAAMRGLSINDARVQTWEEQLAALTQLEAMVGEQEPVATHGKVVKIIGVGEKYRPDAHETGVWLDEDGVCLEFGDGYRDCFYLSRISVIPPAQQPQYEAGDMASAHNDGFRAGAASVAQQPQAEAVHNKPVRVCHIKDVACSEAAVKCGECPDAAPQQAETVPSDVVRDAERYRWLAYTSDTNPIMAIELETRRLYFGRELDDAIDAATAQGEKP